MTIFTFENITAAIDAAANAISIATAIGAAFRAANAFARRIRNRNADRRTGRRTARNRIDRRRRHDGESRGGDPPRAWIARTNEVRAIHLPRGFPRGGRRFENGRSNGFLVGKCIGGPRWTEWDTNRWKSPNSTICVAA